MILYIGHEGDQGGSQGDTTDSSQADVMSPEVQDPPQSVEMAKYGKNTVNRERFAGLNFCGFHPMEFFTGNLSRYLTFKALKTTPLYKACVI